MSNLLLITDVARLQKIFGTLTEDKNIRLRVVNNLEKGGEEIAIEKPDVVFVQTHLSGLSADILLMHLKKQLGRKRSRFVLLASPGQTNAAILKPFQGWLDTSAEDDQTLTDLHTLLSTLLSKPKKIDEADSPEPVASTDVKLQPESPAESSALPDSSPVSETFQPQPVISELQFPVIAPATPEPSLEEQGVTYAPRQRLSVYSEFNSSFDNAVSSTPEPATLEKATPLHAHDWNTENIDSVKAEPARSKKGTFLLWLAPVVVAVVIVTYLQHQKTASKADSSVAKTVPVAVAKPVVKPVAPPPPANVSAPEPAKTAVVKSAAPQAAPQDQDKMSDKAVLTAIAENRVKKSPAAVAPSAARLTNLPEFIPRYGLDKQFSASNPGWERYKGQVTEFKVLREAQTIKAIQIIDRGGEGVPESFKKSVQRQVTKNPDFKIDTTEKKDGYEIQRGRITDTIKVVYYRDEHGGKLRAFVMTWQ